jgi:hypothetical protein
LQILVSLRYQQQLLMHQQVGAEQAARQQLIAIS